MTFLAKGQFCKRLFWQKLYAGDWERGSLRGQGLAAQAKACGYKYISV
jgi:hypothetical protein